MKSISLVGVILLGVSAILFYLTANFAVEEIRLSHVMGVMAGIGIGLIIGGMVGYVSKGSSIKAEQKKKELKQLQKEKEELEKKNLEMEQQKNALQTEVHNEDIPKNNF